jgi:RNA polymerase sigma-32 factor
MSAPMLSREEEDAAARAYRDHQCPKALNTLVRSHMRLCYAVAGQFRAYGLDRDDLVQEGAIGLVKAASKFDPDAGNRFSTYAMYWVYSAVTLFIATSMSVIKGPSSSECKRLFFKLGSTRATLRHLHPELGDDDFDALLADKMGVSVEQLRAHDACRNPASLDAPISPGFTLGDTLQDPAPPADEVLEGKQLRADTRFVMEALADLSGRDRDIFIRRKLTDPAPTLEVLADEYGVTRERIRQLENKAMKYVTAYVLRGTGRTRKAPPKINPLYGQPRPTVSAGGDFEI